MPEITSKGLKKLKKELEHLDRVKRKEIAARLERAISFGDLSENADYEEAKQEYSKLESKIRELRHRLSQAKVIANAKKDGRVRLGSKVTLESKGRVFDYQIVSPEEADPSQGLISSDSPLGRELLGKKTGAKFTVGLPSGPTAFTIRKIF